MKPLAIWREALAAAWGARVASVVSIVIVAGMVAAVLLTTGRTVGAQEGVLNTLDQAGARSIVVRAESTSELNSSVLGRLGEVSSIDWAGAFGVAIDATNSAVPGAAPVAIRFGYGEDLATLGLDVERAIPGVAYASREALVQLGMPAGVGSVTTTSGLEYPVVGELRVPDHLTFLEPLVVIPAETIDGNGVGGENPSPGTGRSTPIAVLVVVADDAARVAELTTLVTSVLDISDPSSVKIETSESLAQLREIIGAELSGSSQALVAVIFAVTAVLVAAILYALVMMRRRDYGRRRALGASQRLIVALVLAQTASLSVIGAIIGAISAFFVLAIGQDPQPPLRYYVAIAVLAAGIATFAALLPAMAAARRDAVRELRVP